MTYLQAIVVVKRGVYMINKKSPLLVAILNFIFLGVGYLYLGKRKVFGWIMILAAIVMTWEYFIGTLNHFTNLIDTHTYSLILVSVAVAVDGYLLAKED